jgi:hypothetical protein
VINVEDDNLLAGFVDTVSDAVLTSTCPPKALERGAQGNPDDLRS